MKLHPLVSARLLPGALLLAGLLALAALPGPTPAEELSREQQIADIERQIQELNRKLTELRRTNGNGHATPAGVGLPPSWVQTMKWRPIGPASMGGRIVALSVFEADPTTYWVATASGGLLKTTNNGTTFEHQFDRENTVSIGDVCVAPSNRNIVWVGTGENNPRNSVSYGDGVYKSTDGGKTWKHMGLEKTFQIGKILVHPTNPDVVYVGALGRLYGASEERGLYKTTDGGRHWDKILYVDERTGVIDMRMSPSEPDTILAATWERKRDEFDSHPGTEMPPAEGYDRYDPIKKWGKGGAIWKTTDGRHFRKVISGLPTSQLGRIGLDWYRKDPKVVFAIIDCEKIAMGPPPPVVYMGVQGESVKGGAKLTSVSPNSPADKAGLKAGDVVKVLDKKDVGSYAQLVNALRSRKPGDKISLKVLRGKETKDITVTLVRRPQGGPQTGGGRPGGGRPGGGRPGGQGAFAGFRGEDTPTGIRVAEVLADTPASRAGLQKGDVIEGLDKDKVTTTRQFLGLLRFHNPGDKVTLRVKRGKDTKNLTMTIARRPGGGRGTQTATRPYSSGLGGQRENVQEEQGPNGYEYGGVYKSTDAGETWVRINSLNPRPMYFSQVRVDPSDDKHLYVCGVQLYRSDDGGKTFKPNAGNGVHPDQHALWIDPRDGRHMIVGCDGGFYATYDRMEHWDYLNNVAIGQFYHVALDSRRPYRAYGGLQDNGSWGGPTHTLDGRGPVNADWIMVGGGDGFVCRVDAQDPDLVYYESQDGNIARRNLRTGQFGIIRPQQRQGQTPYRFNWNTPFILSSHNSRILYSAGNYVFRSLKEGDSLQKISPEITRTKRGSASALAESPRNANVLYAGTDDGYLWVSQDGGVKWTNVADRVGLPGPRWVASIEPSRFADGRVYVAFDAHRSNDDEPYLYVSENYGQSWKPIRANLPVGSTRVLREDLQNENLLYCGTEFAVWASLDRGASWFKINNNLPTVAVHELALHPTAGEMVAATHGRSLWVLDVAPLRQMSKEVLKADATLYRPTPAVLWRREPTRGTPYGSGSRHFIGENPPSGAQLYYSLGKKAKKVSLKVQDYTGKTVRELPGKGEPGLHRLTWELGGGFRRGRGQRAGPPLPAPPPLSIVLPFTGGNVMVALPSEVLRAQAGRPGRPTPPQPAAPGMYRVVLNVDGREYTQGLRIEPDPTRAEPTLVADEDEDEEDVGSRIDD